LKIAASENQKDHYGNARLEGNTGEDYDGFRNHGMRDTMVWRDDPCRQFNEKTDLGGRFVDDPEDDPEN
jgi:hypothetical protein